MTHSFSSSTGVLTLHPEMCHNRSSFCLTGVHPPILGLHTANVQPRNSPVLFHYYPATVCSHRYAVSLPYSLDWPGVLTDELCRLVLCYMLALHGTDHLHIGIYGGLVAGISHFLKTPVHFGVEHFTSSLFKVLGCILSNLQLKYNLCNFII